MWQTCTSFYYAVSMFQMSTCLSGHFFFSGAGSNAYSINLVFEMEGNSSVNPLGRGLLLKFYPPIYMT